MTHRNQSKSPIVHVDDFATDSRAGAANATRNLPEDPADANAQLGQPYNRVEPPNAPVKEKPILLDSPPEWVDRPTIKDQLAVRGAWKREAVKAVTFNLSKAGELKAYNEFLAETYRDDTNQAIMHEDREFNEKTGNWMLLIKYQVVKFKKLISDKRNVTAGATIDGLPDAR